MKKQTSPIKKFLFLTLLIVCLLIAGLAVLVSQIDINQYKRSIESQIAEHSPYQVTLGHISWSFFPRLGLKIEESLIANTHIPINSGLIHQQSALTPALTIETFDITLKLLPLFKKNITVDHIRIIEPSLLFQVFADGSNNWQIEPSTDTAPQDPTEETIPPVLPDLFLQKITLSNGTIDYIDEFSAHESGEITHWQLSSLDFDLTQFGWKTDSPLNINFNIKQLDRKQQVQMALSLAFRSLLNVDIDAESLSLKDFLLQINELKLQGGLDVTQLLTKPTVKSQINIAPINLNQWLQTHFSIDNLPSGALNTFNASIQLNVTPEAIQISPAKIKWDQSTLTSHLNIAMQPNKIQSTSSFHLDQINIDEYISQTTPETAATESSTDTEKDQPADPTLLPIPLLSQLNHSTEINIDKIRYQDISTQDIKVKLVANGGLINLQTFSANTLEGQINANGTIDVRPDIPVMRIEKSISNIQVPALVKFFLGKPLLEGALSFSGQFNSAGNTIEQLTQNLSGSAQLDLNEGALNGIHLTQLVHSKLGKLTPVLQLLTPEININSLPNALTDNTTIKTLDSSITIEKGLFSTNQLSADLEEAKISGQGNWSLKENKGQFDLTLQLDERVSNPYIAQLQWPVNCQIEAAKPPPRCNVDSKAAIAQLQKIAEKAAKEKAKAIVNQKVETEITQPLKEKLKEENTEIQQQLEQKLKNKLNRWF